MIRSLAAQARGVVDVVRRGDTGARALAISDSRVLVRAWFLASAVRLDLLGFLSQPRTFEQLAALTGRDAHGSPFGLARRRGGAPRAPP